MRESRNESKKIYKKEERERKGFLLLSQPRSQGPLWVGEDAGNEVASPLTFPLPPFVCLFSCVFFFSHSKFARNNSSDNGCYAGPFRVSIFCHRGPTQTVWPLLRSGDLLVTWSSLIISFYVLSYFHFPPFITWNLLKCYSSLAFLP